MAVDRFNVADPETEWNREGNCGNDIKETEQIHMDTTELERRPRRLRENEDPHR